MYCFYILESLVDRRWYIGSTANVEDRLKEHNSGRVRSSKPHAPYRVVYIETYPTRSDAVRREQQIKRSGIIRKTIKNQIHRGPIV